MRRTNSPGISRYKQITKSRPDGPDQIIIKKKKKKKGTCRIVDFAVPADRRVKLKECEKRDKYLDLC